MAKRCVLEQTLLLRAYRKSEVPYEKAIGRPTYQSMRLANGRQWPLTFVIIKSNHLFESGDMAHTQALTHTHTIHNNIKEGK